MNWVLYLFGSGTAFFLGVGLVLVGVVVFITRRLRWSKVAATLLVVVGLLLVAFSAVPLPHWLYGLAGGTTVLWLAADRSEASRWRPRRRWFRIAVVGVWGSAVAAELPYHQLPSVPPVSGRPTLSVLGDSIAAGLGGRQEETWPQLLARTHRLDVTDLSQVGATAATALRLVEMLPPGDGVVLVEVGGNDLLGPTSAVDFDRDLNELLARVCRPGRVVLMVELPLPPFCNEYGRVQRRLASAYGVSMIPRRVLMGVLTGDGATTDGLHLTQLGHERMAEAVWAAVRPAYGE